jgi:hypothetical protein
LNTTIDIFLKSLSEWFSPGVPTERGFVFLFDNYPTNVPMEHLIHGFADTSKHIFRIKYWAGFYGNEAMNSTKKKSF